MPATCRQVECPDRACLTNDDRGHVSGWVNCEIDQLAAGRHRELLGCDRAVQQIGAVADQLFRSWVGESEQRSDQEQSIDELIWIIAITPAQDRDLLTLDVAILLADRRA